MVIILGIPFSNIYDLKIKSKEKYLKNKKSNFYTWYINEAFT